MRMIVEFSARDGGNCAGIARYLARPGDQVLAMRDVSARPCAGCAYECMGGPCPYRADGVFDLLCRCEAAEQVIFVVPMYCGGPSALFSILCERGQDYFMCRRRQYEDWTGRLYIVGVFGSEAEAPWFLPGLARSFGLPPERVLGLERRRYGHKMADRLLGEPEVRAILDGFPPFHGGEKRV